MLTIGSTTPLKGSFFFRKRSIVFAALEIITPAAGLSLALVPVVLQRHWGVITVSIFHLQWLLKLPGEVFAYVWEVLKKCPSQIACSTVFSWHWHCAFSKTLKKPCENPHASCGKTASWLSVPFWPTVRGAGPISEKVPRDIPFTLTHDFKPYRKPSISFKSWVLSFGAVAARYFGDLKTTKAGDQRWKPVSYRGRDLSGCFSSVIQAPFESTPFINAC